MSEEWKGEERRGLPVHIINYIDERLRDHADIFNGKLDALQEEVYHLTQSINSWMEKTPEALTVRCEKLIDEAIPTHPDNPDASPIEKRKEHRKAHASWIKRVDEEMEEWRRLRSKLKEWAMIGGVSIIALAVWQWLLNGPKT